MIQELTEIANGRLKIMPGAGVHENNIEQILDSTKAQEVHFSGRKQTSRQDLAFGERYQTDEQRVTRLVQLAKQAFRMKKSN